MAYRITQAPEFEPSVISILDYLEHQGAFNASERFMAKIDEITALLENTPEIKAISTKPFLAERGLREHFFMNYVIVYSVENDVVTLVTLFHQTRDYNSQC